MMKTDDHMDLVERLLAEAAEIPRPEPDAAFLARILADAERLQPRAPGRAGAPGRAPGGARVPGIGGWIGGLFAGGPAGGWLVGLADVFGGRAALAGMMAATVTGLFIGIAQPAMLSGLSSAVYGQTPLVSLDLMAGGDSLWTESQQ